MSFTLNQLPIISTHSLIRSKYSYLSTPISFPENSPVTKQEFADECNINILMSRYQTTGEMPNINEVAPQYIDVSGIEFQDSMNFVAGAQSLFNQLPSTVRTRFHNDPSRFLDFCSNENNREEMAQMGLLKPRAEWVDPTLGLQKQIVPEAISKEMTAGLKGGEKSVVE